MSGGDVVIVGGGPAAHRLAGRLHPLGHRGTVSVIGAEPRPAYNRALLGSVLDGTLSADRLTLPALPAAVRQLTGTRARSIDRARRTVHLDDGRTLPYDILVLATGARPRIPDLPGLVTARGQLAEGARTLRTATDCAPLPPGPVVVLGGGVLGVESALALRRAGKEVTLVQRSARLMRRQLDGPASGVLAQWAQSRGVTLHLGRQAQEYAPGKLVLDDGQVLAAGTLLLCTGTRPETALARASSLAVREGIVVDARLRTGDPLIHAMGDCAQHPDVTGTTLIQAWDQADALAGILTATGTGYRPARHVLRPRIRGMDIVSLAPGATEQDTDTAVSLRDTARGRYARLALREGRIHTGVVVGPGAAVAAVSGLYTRDAPVPADLLALLTGTDAPYAGGDALADDAVACHCNHVTFRRLKAAWAEGAHDSKALARATRATTGCGGCTPVVRQLCTTLAAAGAGAAGPAGTHTAVDTAGGGTP
ncbi:FAD-dependent oxidoreductase [Streptomyces sp. NBC_01314]|uniref:FAD-dependent oxidoreductase n=1 Tax=Streptomyces sp. NBC_01314 TaxID=2903821 RepID=UPI003092DE4A|nr:FAD-dependent oxidoreductase [Streptomyces sp. NBC_01314]WRZ54347.1 FAD-dependent oxidoreductase [Streptomyces sp. NBC_01314]